MKLVGPTGTPLPPAAMDTHPAHVMRVERMELADIRVGRIILYKIHGPVSAFVVGASRAGLELVGQLPPLAPAGVREIQRLIRRQSRQIQALEQTPVGEPQVPLTETELDTWEVTTGPVRHEAVPAASAVDPAPAVHPSSGGPVGPLRGV